MQNATDFGKIIRGLMGKNNLSQDKLAEELGVRPSTFSYYITGKSIPEMELVGKCIKYFGLQGTEIKDIFTAYFTTIAKQNGKIILDTKFFKPERIDLLVEILTILLLYPYDYPDARLEDGLKSLSDLKRELSPLLSSYHDKVHYTPPPD